MRVISTHTRTLALAVIAIAALALAACGGNGESPQAVDDTAGPADDERLVASQAFLRESAARLVEDVSTAKGTFVMEMQGGGFGFSMEMFMVIREPDAVHAMMDMFGQEMEILFVDNELYLFIPGQGWFIADVEDLGFDAQAFQETIETRGMLDINLVADMDDIEQLPDTTIDGETVRHFRSQPEWDRVREESAGLFASDIEELVGEVDADLVIDLYVLGDSQLPRRMVMTMDMEFMGAEATMVMTMDLLEFNVPVDIPDAPANPRNLSELGFDF